MIIPMPYGFRPVPVGCTWRLYSMSSPRQPASAAHLTTGIPQPSEEHLPPFISIPEAQHWVAAPHQFWLCKGISPVRPTDDLAPRHPVLPRTPLATAPAPVGCNRRGGRRDTRRW